MRYEILITKLISTKVEVEADSKEEAIIRCMRRDGVSTWYSNDDWDDYGEEAYRVTEL